MIVLMGKTNSGKSTVVKRMFDLGFKNVVSFTTRPKRDGEIHGKDYYFISKEDFLTMKEKDKFIETRSYDTKVNDIEDTWYYGLSWDEFINKKDKGVSILDLDGTKELVSKVGRENLTIIYLDCSNEEIRRRAKLRGDCPIEAERRLLDDELKFRRAEYYADYVINVEKNVNDIVTEILNVIK